MMKMRKSNLDEQQEQQLLKIESRGFWLAFWGMLVVLFINAFLTKDPYALIAPWALFMVLALYIAFACVRAGIWDRRLDMSRKTIIVISLIGSVSTGAFTFLFTLLNIRSQKTWAGAVSAVCTMFVTFVLCYIALHVVAKAVKNRQDTLNAEPDDTMSDK